MAKNADAVAVSDEGGYERVYKHSDVVSGECLSTADGDDRSWSSARLLASRVEQNVSAQRRLRRKTCDTLRRLEFLMRRHCSVASGLSICRAAECWLTGSDPCRQPALRNLGAFDCPFLFCCQNKMIMMMTSNGRRRCKLCLFGFELEMIWDHPVVQLLYSMQAVSRIAFHVDVCVVLVLQSAHDRARTEWVPGRCLVEHHTWLTHTQDLSPSKLTVEAYYSS